MVSREQKSRPTTPTGTKGRILVVYYRTDGLRTRSTIDEHLYCFRRYVDHVDFDYFNAANGFPRYLTWAQYDGVILHYTFMAIRWRREWFLKFRPALHKRLKSIRGYKVAMPQDEYAETDLLWALCRDHGIKTIFTCFTEKDFETAYPQAETGADHLVTVHPGYIDEMAAKKVEAIAGAEAGRSIDVGYRARRVPYWLGRHGQMKCEVGDRFAARLKGDDLVFDISNQDRDAFMGKDWYRFLCRCRVALGCEGGASLLDATGAIRPQVDAYVREHPDASFEEVEKACFSGMDDNISLFALSPRHFECTITRTCQALIEGEYGGIFRPGEHYIEIKRDFSNINQVIEQIRDHEACQRIAERAYRDIYQTGRFTYRVFANQVVDHILAVASARPSASWGQRTVDRSVSAWLGMRERLDPVLSTVLTAWCLIRVLKLGVIPWGLRRLRGASWAGGAAT